MFQGFTEKVSPFFWELSFNNERSWFKEHKNEFEEIIDEPLKALAQALVERLNEKYPAYDWQPHVSRIYRDARRLYGRGPLKDHMWVSFYRNGAEKTEPTFWFGVSSTYYCWGMGFYETDADMMEQYRKAIEANPARFERIINGLGSLKNFQMEGEPYKRPKGSINERIDPWYNMKYFSVEYSGDDWPEICSAQLPERIAKDFEKIMPLYVWLLELFGSPDGPGPNWGLK